MPKPNVLFLLADQWRAQALGYAGDSNAWTPHIDALERDSVHFTEAVSACPVCSPYRAGLLTGQYPLTHGVFVNDVCLNPEAMTLGKLYKAAGYATAYIGKWHVDGHGRAGRIPAERRHGFEYWKTLECTHDYNHSAYYDGDAEKPAVWEGYDAAAQTRDAQAYITGRDKERPFLLVLAWGPPHDPYETAPESFQRLHLPEQITLRPNVPEGSAAAARQHLAGYYAHCAALDTCVGALMRTLNEEGIAGNTIVVFTSDHGDMLGSQGHEKKQRPWDESVRVPFLLRYPGCPGWQPRHLDAPLNTPDILPTLLGLSGLEACPSAEGMDFSGHIRGGTDPSDGAALILCAHPFGQWIRSNQGREYRGIRTRTHTYVRTLEGPWLLYDNRNDPYQMTNLCGRPECAELQRQLETRLQAKLDATRDAFLPGADYIRQWGYTVDENGTVPYTN